MVMDRRSRASGKVVGVDRSGGARAEPSRSTLAPQRPARDPTATVIDLPVPRGVTPVQSVERAEYEGVDYAWVMQTTFVVTILVGAPVVAALSTLVVLESWEARAIFAVRVGAPVWFVTAIVVALYARRTEAGDGGKDGDTEADGAEDDVETNGNAETDDDAETDGAEEGDTETGAAEQSATETG